MVKEKQNEKEKERHVCGRLREIKKVVEMASSFNLALWFWSPLTQNWRKRKEKEEEGAEKEKGKLSIGVFFVMKNAKVLLLLFLCSQTWYEDLALVEF